MEYRDVVVDVWGKRACFTHPANRGERFSYPCITPSAARGILCSIYMKPIEFYYEITKIEIINPIQYDNVVINEVNSTIPIKEIEKDYFYIDTTNTGHKERGRWQRSTYFLKDVYYRIHAKIIKRDDFKGSIDKIHEQFERRIKKGQCFNQPCLGLSSFICFFSEPDYNKQPLEFLNMNIGTMLYDVFDIKSNIQLNTDKKVANTIKKASPSFFKAKITNGVLEIPEYNSKDIRRCDYV